MERSDRPKLKNAVVALRKLNLSCEVRKSTNGKEIYKEIPETFDNEDPSSENISTASVGSTILCTDDDDLEKKIQAFSIPIKKDEKLPNCRNDKEASKICDDLDNITDKETENSKLGSKQSFLSEKSHVRSKENTLADTNASKQLSKSSDDTATQKLEIKSIRNKRKTRKGKPNKNKIEIVPVPGNKLSLVKQQKSCEVSKSNMKASRGATALVAGGKEDRRNERVSITGRKAQQDEQNNTLNDGKKSEGKRKRKVQQEENTVSEPIKLVKRQLRNLSSETDMSASHSVEKKTRKNTETVIKLDTDKKKVFPNTRKRNSNDALKVKRSSRISARINLSKFGAKHIKATKKLEVKSQPQVLKAVIQKRHSNSKDRKDNSPKLKTANKADTVNTREKVTVVAPKQASAHSIISSEPKDNANTQLQSVNTKNVKSQTSVTSKKNDLNANNEKLTVKRRKLNRNTKNNSSGIFEEGEDLLEKICDILEDTNAVSECSSGGRTTNVSKELPVIDHRTDSIVKSTDIILPSFLIPKMLNKSFKFPSYGKGTESYKKLWKWSHCVRLPSEMWSLYKHFNGNFVVILHVSETSPFPNLLIDKCIIFNETASPVVKICGEDISALGSKEELQTLGQVCSFLKHIHDLSLCEGRSVGEKSKNCELYTDKIVSLPFKCKYCSCL